MTRRGLRLSQFPPFPQGEGVSPAEQFYLLAAMKNGQRTFC